MTKQISKARPESVAKKASGERYFEGVGRRKTAVARVRVFPGSKDLEVTVNGKSFKKYFPLVKSQNVGTAPFRDLSLQNFNVSALVRGGGLNAQAEAIRLGVARALIAVNPSYRPNLKTAGYLTRDQRMVERKKPGLRKARRPQQWRKR